MPVPSGAQFRVAALSDCEAIERLMKRSARGLSRSYYSESQIPSVERFVAALDRQLIADGTYFVGELADEPGTLVACGGWSWRAKLYAGGGDDADDTRRLDPATEPARIRAMFVHPDYARRGLGRTLLSLCEEAARAAGFSRLELMATLPGVPLYTAMGFGELERVVVTLPDGVVVDGVRMGKAVSPGAHATEGVAR